MRCSAAGYFLAAVLLMSAFGGVLETADKNECYTYFRITGIFEPDEITERLGLQPAEQRRIGEERKNGTAYEFASWTFGRCDSYDVITANQMLKTIEPLLSKVNILWNIKQAHDVRLTLEVVPTVYTGESLSLIHI